MLASEGSAGAGHAFGRMILVGFATSKGDDGGSPPSRGRACISVACRFRCRKSFPYRGCSHASSEPVVPSASALGPTKRLVFFSVRFLRRHDPHNVRNRPRPDATELPSPAGAVSAIAGSIRTGLDRCVSWTFLGLRPVGAGRFGGVRTGTAKTGDAPRYRSVGGVRRIAGVSVRYAGRSLRRAGGAACAAADRPRTMRRRSRG